MKTVNTRSRRFSVALALQILVLLVLVYPFVSACFRDNDQASILSGGWQIAHRQAPFLHATFYNFDKQWGAFLALTGLYRLFPSIDPVLSPNIMLTALASLAWLSLGWRTGRSRNTPLPLLLPVLLAPALILYVPYFGTGWLSLAFLLLAFFCLGGVRSKLSVVSSLLLVAAAAACRGDVVLAMPALALSQMSRASGIRVLKRPLLWGLGAAAVLPVFLGKWMAGSQIPDANPLSFDAKSYFGFLLFGFSPALLLLLIALVGVYLVLAWHRRRFALFYAGLAAAPFVPFAFYSLQLYTLRYFFLTIASILFIASSRRSAWLYRGALGRYSRIMRRVNIAIVSITILPWLIGCNVPVLPHPRLTLTNPTRFPTGDGKFPMGAYLGFEWQVLFLDHMAVDHNQKIWLSARTTAYQSCSNGGVPFLVTPMSNFIEFAIRLQRKIPQPIDYMAESSCGLAYVDTRSIMRGYRPTDRDGHMFSEQIEFVSSTNNGQPIVQVDANRKANSETETVAALRKVFGIRDVEIYLKARSIPVIPGLKYAVFSDHSCPAALRFAGKTQPSIGIIQATWTGQSGAPAFEFDAKCTGSWSGWARTALPPYMGM